MRSITFQPHVSFTTQSSSRQEGRPRGAVVPRAIQSRLGATARVAADFSLDTWIVALRSLRGYVGHHRNHVVVHDEKGAAVGSAQRRHNFWHSWGQEGDEVVLPANAVDADLSAADDIRPAAQDKMSARCERLPRCV